METKYKIHFSYIISILLVIIVVLASVEWSDNSDLIKYISFASTIASLLLALLAIVYAYLSNATFSKNITLINEVSNELKTNTSNLSIISETLEKDLKKLPLTLEGVDKKVDALPELLSKLTPKEIIKKEEVNSAISNLTEVFSVKEFLETSSYTGLLSLYGIVLAHAEKTPFNLQDFTNEIEILEFDYSLGYLIASSAFGIFNYKSSKSIWNITEMNQEFADKIEKSLFEKGKEVQEDLSKDDIEFDFSSDIELAKKYFND